MPVIIILGVFRTGSLVSSAMLTESPNPTIAKNASDVAAVAREEGGLVPGRFEHRCEYRTPLDLTRPADDGRDGFDRFEQSCRADLAGLA